MTKIERLPKNAPGDFYTNGTCLSCGTPESLAPDLLAPLTPDNWDTYFVRQPENADQIERACQAVECCCVDALRYGGNDPEIIRRLGNDPHFCDQTLPGGLVRRPTENDFSWMMSRPNREGER